MKTKDIILILSILCVALIVTVAVVSNRATDYRHKIYENYVELDSVLHVARMQYYKIESLKIYATKTKYYELLYDSLMKDNQYLESVFTSNYKRVKLLHEVRRNDYNEYKYNIQMLDSIYSLNQKIIYDTVTVEKNSKQAQTKEGFFKRLFKKKN